MLQAINGWDLNSATLYLEFVQRTRAAHTGFKLDLTWLTSQGIALPRSLHAVAA
jgi:hypothetical protein